MSARPDDPDSFRHRPDDITYAQLPVQAYSAALEGEEPGTFEASVTTFNKRVEGLFYDQRLKRGCFMESLALGWPAVIWSHDWDTPPIGATLGIREEGNDLIAKGRLFVADGEDSQKAREVYTAMRAQHGDGRNVLREFSIGFRIQDAEWAEEGEEEVLDIKKASLWEYGPCLVGRNVNRLIGVQAVGGAGARFAAPSDPAEDPILQRFPRPSGRPSAEQMVRRRELLLARQR